MKLITTLALALLGAVAFAEEKKTVNTPAAPATAAATERVTFGGGCFWCIEAVFQRIDGVKSVKSGYAGGTKPNPTYEDICEGNSGHIEVVQLEFDPARVSFAHLMKVFFAAHDPTAVLKEDTRKGGRLLPKGTPYQGADVGEQYRSVIFTENDAQKSAAEKAKADAQKDFKEPIATWIKPLEKFWVAERYHQNYYNQNAATNGYCSAVITPKLRKLIEKGMIKGR